MVLGQIQKFPAYGIAFYGHATLEVMRMIGAFVVGAIGYPLLELIYRKRTHYSMAVAGGIGLCLMQVAASMPCMMIIKVAFASTEELDTFINQLQIFGNTQTQIVFSTAKCISGVDIGKIEAGEYPNTPVLKK